MSEDQKSTRYSDAELAEFQVLIENKLAKAEEERTRIQERLQELEEQADSDRSDYIDDSSNAYDVEHLNNLEYRQRRHIQDLKNALLRIKNRTYGICVITGQLIDKRRLMAVPTTTKSLEAKMRPTGGDAPASEKEPDEERKTKPVTGEKKIISRVIKKSGTPKPAARTEDDEDDELIDDLHIPESDDEDIDDLDSLISPDYEEDEEDDF